MNKFEYVNASSLQRACEQLKADGSVRAKAGGIDLLDELKERIIAPQRLVNIKTIAGLNEIKEQPDGIRIGPLVTLAQVAANELVRKRFVALAEAAQGAATPQIRNVATIGGNLCQRPRCWYYRNEDFQCFKKGGDSCFAQQGDNRFHAIFNNNLCAIVHPSATAVALVALGAFVRVTDAGGNRMVALEKFFTLPETDVTRENILKGDELISDIFVPALAANARSFYIKQKEKESFDWPLADTAVVLEMDGDRCQRARIVLGAAAPVPWRAVNAEALLQGKKIDAASAREAARAALTGARALAHNGYKLPLFETIIARTIIGAAGRA